eukprot:NODE_5424_length_578_cov_69.018904_g4706_i0.p3 GENE.NODE_5424_length_578_cov_69.018904_g4706_i0~~NODE_5424_length_578_cov_69.018904_g4706_i0.p3  ORF type:complete len:66 (-),score=23.73 NODE_5424_length_578_cov_69.018904_g4706_i0:263-460(-)
MRDNGTMERLEKELLQINNKCSGEVEEKRYLTMSNMGGVFLVFGSVIATSVVVFFGKDGHPPGPL